MNATKRSIARSGLVFCSALILVATGCVVHERTRTVYVSAPPPAVSVPPEPAPDPTAPAGPAIVIQAESDFYEPLESYGRWVVAGSYGRCWVPARVEVGWRPYSHGYWQRTDAGWYWASDEPWGWATYHYGRWDFHTEFGWIWVPHTQWAPAWVCWREGGGYVGWAPLRPSLSIGVSIGSVDYEPSFAARAFVFVEHRRMLEPVRPKTVVINNTTVINKTVNITKVNVVNKTVINEGPRVEVIERASGHKVRPVPVHEFRRKEETTVASRERNIPTANTRRVQPPGRPEAHEARASANVPHGSRVTEKAPAVDEPAEVTRPSPAHEKPAEIVAERTRPSPAPAPLRPVPVETEKREHEQNKREWVGAKKVIPPEIDPAGKPEVKLEPAGSPGRDFRPIQKKPVRGKPTPPPVTINPVIDEARDNASADKRATTAPASGEFATRNDAGSEIKPEVKPPLKIEAAPPAEERTQRRQISPREKSRAPEHVLPNPGDDVRDNTSTDKRATPAPAGELAPRNDVGSEIKWQAKPPQKIEAAPPAEERTHRQQISPKEKSRAAERVPSNKKAKEAKEQPNNKSEEQDSTSPPGSARQSR